MAKEYIEREAALEEVDNADVMCDIPPDAYRVLRRYIERIPAADVVPVVRCGECVFHEIADYGDGYTKNVCRLFNRQIQNDDYCSYGMRKDGDRDA